MENQIGRIFGGIIFLIFGFSCALNPRKHAIAAIKACKKDITQYIDFAKNFIRIVGILFIFGGILSLVSFIFNLLR